MKKHILISVLAGCAILGGTTSCNDDFMQKDPINNMSDNTFLTNEGDLPYYLNNLYNTYIWGFGYSFGANWSPAPWGLPCGRIAAWDIMSDNVVRSGGASSRLTNQYTVPASGTGTGWDWTGIRSINYFLTHYKQAESSVSDPSVLDKWAAEAYFFKAWDYYNKIAWFGEVPWLERDLNIDSEELYGPKTPRAELADKVLDMLNFAVDNIRVNTSADPDGRINVDMANFLKARYCLFEGTFRKYHTDYETELTPKGSLSTDYERFLRECVTACEAIIATNYYKLYTGNKRGLGSYWELFTFKNNPVADGNTEAILARTYDGDQLGHDIQRYYEMNRTRCTIGATKGMVDEYLCIDGQTIQTSPLFKGYDGDDWRELDNRDPRLKQSIVKPGEMLSIYYSQADWATFKNARNTNGGTVGTLDAAKNGIRYPEISYQSSGSGSDVHGFGTTSTGYWIIKHWMADDEEYSATAKGHQTGIEFRYAEVLLMLAEAKAELGEFTQADADRTINELRKRAGFNFTTYPGSKLTVGSEPADPYLDNLYASKVGYTISPTLREIRRERRVELFQEGRRNEDLVRWKAGKLMEVPLRGMKFTTEKQALYNGANVKPPKMAPESVLNVDIFTDEDGFIICYPKTTTITNGTLTWNDRSYFQPIPIQELTINQNLSQSPGWPAQ